jgi:mycothiol S-conjugate amidase
MARRLMFVHAHPDDEASKGAATAARYVDDGAEVVLVTCTGGEAGDVLNPSAAAVSAQDMPATRARELEAAVAAIGFTRTYGLGYVDSGYHEDPADVPEGSFARTRLDEPSTTLAGLIRRERPHVLVTYPEDGGYPHPDHIMNHLVTMRALELAEDPDADLSGTPGGTRSPWRAPKVYASDIFPPERIHALHDAMLAAGLDSPFAEWLDQRAKRGRGPSPEPDARVECADWFERRDAALRAHVTQIDPDGFWFQIPRELERDVYPYEGYVLLRSDVTVQPGEDDLFAGLDLTEEGDPGEGTPDPGQGTVGGTVGGMVGPAGR